MKMAQRWWKMYQRTLREKPIRTNIISGAIVMLMGDSLAQGIERDRQNPSSENNTTTTNTTSSYDLNRAAVMVSWSALGDVPITMSLFHIIERTMKQLGIPARASFPKSIIKAICFFVPGTIIRMPCFLAYATTLEHLSRNVQTNKPLSSDWEVCMDTVGNKMREDLGEIFYNGARLWIPVNTLAFYAIPVEMRTLVLSSVTVGWMTYLSLIQHK